MKYKKELLEDFKKLGIKIQKIREQKHLSIKDLSYKTGIRAEYLKKIEEGIAFGVLIKRHLFKIANALDVELHDLLHF